MANVQLENGYVRIASELQKALARTRIPGECRQLLDAIIIYTYGWHKKHATIGTFQLMEATGLPKRAVEKARKRLREMNIISTAEKGGTYSPRDYTINKDYATWILPPKKVVPPKKVAVVPPKKVPECRPKSGTLKIDKDSIKDKNPEPPAGSVDNSVNKELKEALDRVYKDGFNIYGLLNQAKAKLKHPGARIFPDEVLIAVCDEYWKYKGAIRDAWPWFERVLVKKYQEYNANQNIAQAQVFKTQGVMSLKEIMEGIGKHGK